MTDMLYNHEQRDDGLEHPERPMDEALGIGFVATHWSYLMPLAIAPRAR